MANEHEIKKPYNSELDISNVEAYRRDNTNNTDIEQVVFELDEPSDVIDNLSNEPINEL